MTHYEIVSVCFMTYRGLLILWFVATVCVQTAAVAVFGAGSWTRYYSKSLPTMSVDWSATTDVYFDWCFWMAVAGGALTLLSAMFYLIYDCCFDRIAK